MADLATWGVFALAAYGAGLSTVNAISRRRDQSEARRREVLVTGDVRPHPDDPERPLFRGCYFLAAILATRRTRGVLRRRAARAWNGTDLDPLGFHEARHSYASLCIDAGMNVKMISSYLGHASIRVTLDVYSHLLPDNAAEGRDLLDAYLDQHGG